MLDSYRDLIDELLGTPTTLRDLAGADPSPEALGLIAALRDRDEVVLRRLQTMLHRENAVLSASEADSMATDDALSGFDTARGELISLLMNLTLKDWERTAIDEHGEEITVADEVERHVEFDEAQVERVREAQGRKA